MVTWMAKLQSPVQALFQPSMWIPCFKRLHSYKERWQTDASPADFRAAVVEAIEKVMKLERNTEHLEIHKISDDDHFIRIFAFTRAEWLDIVEIKFEEDGYEVYSFSSGFFPLIVPLACILNMVFFWIPFLDNNFNKRRMKRIREELSVEVKIVEHSSSKPLLSDQKEEAT